jgi:hypothetical protein
MPTSLISPNVDNYYIGKGKVYIKLAADADYVDVGNVPEFEFTPTIDKLDHFSSRAGIKAKDKSVAHSKSATVRVVMDEWTARNLALALMGAVDDSDLSAVTINILELDDIQAAVKFVGANEVGPKWTYILPTVIFTPSKALQPISDAWGQIEISGDVLFDENTGSFGTATADFSAS